MKQSGFGHLTAVAFHGLLQGRRRLAGRREQGFDQATGFPFIETDELALADGAFGGFAGMHNDKGGQGTSLHRGGLLEEKFIRRADARNESLRFAVFCHSLHDCNVCLRGTHCKF